MNNNIAETGLTMGAITKSPLRNYFVACGNDVMHMAKVVVRHDDEARSKIKKMGWTVINGIRYCPRCSENQE